MGHARQTLSTCLVAVSRPLLLLRILFVLPKIIVAKMGTEGRGYHPES